MENRDAYIEKFDKQLKDWDIKIDKLFAGAGKAGKSDNIEISKHIELIKQKRENVAGKLRHLKDADADAWESIVESAQKAWDELNQAVHIANYKLGQ